MVSALNSYTKENPAKSVEAMREALGDPEDDSFENLHQDRYEDLRKAIRLSMKDSARVAERLQTMTELLKNPETAFDQIPALANQFEKETPSRDKAHEKEKQLSGGNQKKNNKRNPSGGQAGL